MNPPIRPRTLIACIGNIFLGDDAFGCEVARTLASMPVPPGTAVVDFGIRGFDLAGALLEPYQAIVLVDAIERGSPPGTIYILQPAADSRSGEVAPDLHLLDPARLLALARSMGEITADVYIVGCEPHDLGDELEGRMGLSGPVRSAVPRAAQVVLDLVARFEHPEKELHTAA